VEQVQTSGSLVFPPFRAEDYKQEVHAQIYRCVARNSAGSIVSRDIHARAGKTFVTFYSFPYFTGISFIRFLDKFSIELS
jgi:hypothetical protein